MAGFHLLERLKAQGRAFEACCPRDDDIWLTVNALRAECEITQIGDRPARYRAIPGWEKGALMWSNVEAGGNQSQIARTLSERDIARLEACQRAETGWGTRRFPSRLFA